MPGGSSKDPPEMDGRRSPIVTRSLQSRMAALHPPPDASFDPAEGTDAPRRPSRAPGTPSQVSLQLQASEESMEGQQSTQDCLGTGEAAWDQAAPSVNQLTDKECRELLHTLLTPRGTPQATPRGTPARGASGHRVSPSPASRSPLNMEPATLGDPGALELLEGNFPPKRSLQLPRPTENKMAAPRSPTPTRLDRPQLGLEAYPDAPATAGIRAAIQVLAAALEATTIRPSTSGLASLPCYPQGPDYRGASSPEPPSRALRLWKVPEGAPGPPTLSPGPNCKEASGPEPPCCAIHPQEPSEEPPGAPAYLTQHQMLFERPLGEASTSSADSSHLQAFPAPPCSLRPQVSLPALGGLCSSSSEPPRLQEHPQAQAKASRPGPELFSGAQRSMCFPSELQAKMRSEHAQSVPFTNNQRKIPALVTRGIPLPFTSMETSQRYDGQGPGSAQSDYSVLPNNFEKLHLDGGNFSIWNKELQVCLLKEGTLEMVLDPPPFPWGTQEEWYHRKAYTTLLSSLDAKLYPSIPDGLTASEVWGLLYSLFNSDSLGSTTRLTSEFYNTKLKFGASMAEHLGKLNALRAELVLRDYPVTEANMIAIILASLDRSWGNFIVSLEGTKKEAMTLTYLTGRLNEEDRRRRDAGEYTRATTQRTSRRHQDSEQVNALLKCFICGSEEHLKKDCPHHQQGPKRSSKQGRGKGQRRGRGRGKGGAKGNFMGNCYQTPATGLWLLDSGASSHIANLKQGFKGLRRINSSVKVANGDSTLVVGEGTVSIPGLGNVKGVLRAPSIANNLLSIIKLCDDGRVEVLFRKGGGYVTRDQKVIGKINIINGLPYFSPKGPATEDGPQGATSEGACAQKKKEAPQPAPRLLKGRKAEAVAPKPPQPAPRPSKASTGKKPDPQQAPKASKPIEEPKVPAPPKATKAKGVSVGKPLHDKCVHLLHRRLGHASFPVVKKMGEFAEGVHLQNCEVFLDCAICKKAKRKAAPIPKVSSRKTQHPYQLVHIDLVGPFTPSLGKRQYFLTAVDDFSRYGHVYTLTEKSEAFDAIKSLYNFVETQHKTRIAQLQSDRGAEFMSRKFQDWVRQKGIRHFRTAPFTPAQNGVAEKRNGILQTMVRSLIADAGVAESYWAEAVHYANYTLNRTWSSVVDQTPYFLVHGRKPKLGHLRVFGSYAWVHIPKQLRKKGRSVSQRLRFLGYAPGSKAYRFLGEGGRTVTSQSASFEEDSNWTQIHSNDLGPYVNRPSKATPAMTLPETTTDPATDESEEQDEEVSLPGPEGEDESFLPDSSPSMTPQRPVMPSTWDRGPPHPSCEWPTDEEPAEEKSGEWQKVRRSKRSNKGVPPRRIDIGHIASINNVVVTPKTFSDIQELSIEEQERWQLAMEQEMESLRKLKVFTPQQPPEKKKVIGTRWVFKAKPLANDRYLYKARLVAQGFAQRYMEDYMETYSPTVRAESVKAALVTAAALEKEVYQFDIQTAYLHANLDRQIYVRAPPGYQQEGGNTWLLHKGLYGLKQSGKLWYDCLRKGLERIGFRASHADECVFTRDSKGNTERVLVYVDDLLYIGPGKERCD